MAEAGKKENDKARMSAYGAATTALRKAHEADFQQLLQVEYDKRNLGGIPTGRVAARLAREEKVKKDLAAKLEKKRQELVNLESAASMLN